MKNDPTPRKARKKRVYAPTHQDVPLLSPAAQRVARISASRIAEPAVAAAISRLRELFATELKCRLAMCDVILELVEQHGLRQTDIARELGRAQSDISDILKTARAFPPADRPAGVPYNHLRLAADAARKFPSLRLSPHEALHTFRARGLTQTRDVSRLFATMDRNAAASATLRLPAEETADAFNRAYHSSYQALLSVFPDRFIHLLHIDPPYADQSQAAQAKSACCNACDNAEPAEAIGVVVDLLRQWQPKLATNGIALLWQPWGVLHPEIVSAIAEHKWAGWGPVVWNKQRPQPGRFVSPYAIQGEMMYVLHRPGDKPRNCDGSSRESILSIPPVSFSSTARHQLHAFEKPERLMKRLLFKHSRAGDLVFDACGCTGSMSKVAINHGRRWVYAESNAANYRLGTDRINWALPAARSAAC